MYLYVLVYSIYYTPFYIFTRTKAVLFMAVVLDFQGIKTVTRLVDHLSMLRWCDSNFRNELVAVYSKRVPNNEI